MALNREQVLAKRHDFPRCPVELPSGGSVLVRVLSLGQLAKLVADVKALTEAGKAHETTAAAVAACACDEAGAPLFTESDREALLDLRRDDLEAVADAAMTLNGMGGKADEDARKN